MTLVGLTPKSLVLIRELAAARTKGRTERNKSYKRRTW
jgi:hypothetical protein